MPEIHASGAKRDDNYVRRTAARYKREFPQVDEEAIKVSVGLNACYNAQRTALSRFYDSLGLPKTAGRFTLLRAIYFAEKRQMTSLDLAEELMVSAANISYLVDGLARDGLVQRVAHETDKRASNIRLTPAGEELCRKVVPEMPGFLEGMVDDFTDEEKALFNQFLSRYLKNAARSHQPEATQPPVK